MEIKEMMISALNKVAESGAIEKKIEETIQKTIDSVINDLFRSYSDFGKDLEKKLAESVKVNLENIDLPRYNVLIENYIKQQTKAVMNENYQKLVDERLSDILKVEEKPEWKMSEILEKIVEENKSDEGENEYEKLTFIHDNWSGDHWHIYIDPEPDKTNYDCCIEIDLADGKINGARIGDFRTKDFKKDKFIKLYGVEALIFRLYSQGVKIIVDVDDCEDTSYYPDPYN